MASLSIEQLALATKGKVFGELVFYQMSTQPYSKLAFSQKEAVNCLGREVRGEVSGILDKSGQLIADGQFWSRDCGTALIFLTTKIRDYFAEKRVQVSDTDVIQVFNIVVTHFALTAFQNSKVKKTLRNVVQTAPAGCESEQTFGYRPSARPVLSSSAGLS